MFTGCECWCVFVRSCLVGVEQWGRSIMIFQSHSEDRNNGNSDGGSGGTTITGGGSGSSGSGGTTITGGGSGSGGSSGTTITGGGSGRSGSGGTTITGGGSGSSGTTIATIDASTTLGSSNSSTITGGVGSGDSGDIGGYRKDRSSGSESIVEDITSPRIIPSIESDLVRNPKKLKLDTIL